MLPATIIQCGPRGEGKRRRARVCSLRNQRRCHHRGGRLEGAAPPRQGRGGDALSAISRVTQLKVPRKRGRFRDRDMHFRHAVCGMEWNTAQSIRGRVVRLVTRDVCTRLDALDRHFHRHCVEVCLVFRASGAYGLFQLILCVAISNDAAGNANANCFVSPLLQLTMSDIRGLNHEYRCR